MKKFLFFAILLSLFSVASRAQVCIPDGTLLPGGISPDTASGQNFIDGNINQAYSDVYSCNVPDSVTYSGFSVALVHIKYLGVTGLPHGITAQANVADSLWLAGTSGCVKLSGTPDTSGTFPIVLKQSVSVMIGTTPYSIPLNNTSYTITIIGGAGVEQFNSYYFDVFTDFNAMSSENINVNIKANDNMDVNMQIYSVSGQQVYNSKKHLSQGSTKINIDKHLNSGIYTLKVDSDKRSVTRKIIVL